MEISSNPTQDEIKKAAKVLKDGHLVAFPTETVYGLGADATNEMAVGRIYSVKGRPLYHPLIVHIASFNQLDKWAKDIPDYAIKLAKAFWPGPMTLILKRSDLPKDFITGGQENVGIRVPDHPVALELLNEFEKIGGLGVAAPSANRFGAISPTNADAVQDELGKFLGVRDLIIDGGQCAIGIESTIIDCRNDIISILRPGEISNDKIFNLTCVPIEDISISNIKVSGNIDKHYSPKASVLLDVVPKPGQGFIALSTVQTPDFVIRIASPDNAKEFAKILYAALRKCDKDNLKEVVIYLPVGDSLEIAIRDRASKASGINS